MTQRWSQHYVTRRTALRGMAGAITVVPFASLLGCGDDHMKAASSTDGGMLADASSGGDAAASGGGLDAATITDWATGGTASMTDKASYRNPFTALGSTCDLTCEATIGPCHTTSAERMDVSDGMDGLPMRLALRVVDDSCAPVEGALVEIWHTNYLGVYSGRISDMCNKNEVDKAAAYFRGYQKTDANGRVDFDSCFPGWYTSRALHIHVRVLKGDYVSADNAEAWEITRLFFPAALIKSIFTNQVLYKDRGQPDTSLDSDNVIGGETDKSPYLCDVAQMTDGAMLASKTIKIRSALSDTSCTAKGAANSGGMPGGGGPGGNPPDGGMMM